ncbi:MAG: gamma-butyrobetaine hydroxylase-like domain-containing protein [Terriglobales bacterium]
MTPEPLRVDVSLRDGVTIAWSDGHTSRYAIAALRAACPCATCHDLHGTGASPPAAPQPSLLPIYQPSGATLEGVKPVGRYALQFLFSDRHNTGIYTWEYLRALCPCDQCKKRGSAPLQQSLSPPPVNH